MPAVEVLALTVGTASPGSITQSPSSLNVSARFLSYGAMKRAPQHSPSLLMTCATSVAAVMGIVGMVRLAPLALMATFAFPAAPA